MNRRYFILTTIGIAIAFLSWSVALASSLSVTPSRVTADQPLTPGHSYTLPIYTVINDTNTDMTVEVSVADHAHAERKRPPAEWFTFDPTEQTVEAESEGKIVVEVSLPIDAPPGEYTVYFRFSGTPETGGGITHAVALQVPFIFAVKGLDRTVTLSIEGEGTLTPAPGEYTYQQGTRLELLAEPAEGWQFSHWIGLPLEAGAQATHTIVGDIDITAVFERQEYQLIISELEGEGTVSPEPGSYTHAYEGEVGLSASPSDLWKFARWEGPVADETAPDTTVTVLGDAEVRAVFAPLELQSLKVEPSSVQLLPEDSRDARVFAVYEDGTEREVTEDVTWASADDAVATLSDEGIIIARSLGETALTAEYEGLTAQLEMEVVEASDIDVSESATAVYPWVLLAAALAAGGLIIHRRRNSSGDSSG